MLILIKPKSGERSSSQCGYSAEGHLLQTPMKDRLTTTLRSEQVRCRDAEAGPLKEHKAKFAVLIVTGLLISACQTGVVFTSPPMKARVLDSRTSMPIENAVVTMWSSVQPESYERGTSDKNGIVNLPRLMGRLKILFPFVADRIVPNTVARFEAKGYVSKDINSNTDLPYFAGTQPVELEPSTGS
jgi:hypothetical protein